MKIYFAGSIRGGRDEEDNYMQLIHHLTTFGEVLTEHVGSKGIDKSELTNTNQYIYERDIDWLKKSDVMVADVTVPSLGVGYEIGFAEQLNIPILCLFNPKNKKSLSAMVSGNRKIINNEYQSINDAKLVLDNFFANL